MRCAASQPLRRRSALWSSHRFRRRGLSIVLGPSVIRQSTLLSVSSQRLKCNAQRACHYMRRGYPGASNNGSRNLPQATSTHFFHPVLVKSSTISKLLESLWPPLPPHNQSWERNRGDPAIAQMALHFTRACASQNVLPTLTARGEGAGSTTGQVLKWVLISQRTVPQECSNKRR